MDEKYISRSELFLSEVNEIIREHLSDINFDVKYLSAELKISESTLRRKMQKITKTSPVELIRKTRLIHAGRMLRTDTGSISEIARAVGFRNLPYFSKCFHDYFGMKPSLYKKNKK